MKKLMISLLFLSLNVMAEEAQKKQWTWFPLIENKKEESITVKPKIAVISLIGEFDITQAMFDLTDAAKNKECCGILLNIDCTGGDAGKFSALHDLIKEICFKKPVVGLVIGSALSGGYLIGSATNYLIAQSISVIGSIGVICEVNKYKEAKVTGSFDAKLEVEVFSAGQFKTIQNPYQILSEQDREYIKEELEKAYTIFLKIVAEDRNLDVANFKIWAEGKTHLAPDALKIGLIDEIGTIFKAEKKFLELLAAKNPDCLYDAEVEFVNYSSPKRSA